MLVVECKTVFDVATGQGTNHTDGLALGLQAGDVGVLGKHAHAVERAVQRGRQENIGIDELAALLHGHGGSATRLSDAALVKLFRLLRLARRLLDLEAGDPGHEF